MNQVNNKDHFLALTGVRAIAAYMVFLHHSSTVIKSSFGEQAHDIIKEFHIGVTLFFVLSGFLIAHRYLDAKNFVFKDYMINRFARIYPTYFFITTITFVVFALFKKDDYTFSIYLLNITFIKGFFKDYIFSGISQGWTLTVEETFYVLAPLFFFLIRKSKNFLILLPIIVILIGAFLVKSFGEIDFYGFFASWEFMFNGTFFGRCFEFFIGIGLAVVLRNHKIRFKYMTYIGMIVIAISIYLLSVIKIQYNLDSGNLHPYGMVVNNLFLPLFGIAPFFYGLVVERTPVSAILKTPIFVLLGRSSYVFYLIHMGLLPMILHKLTSNSVLIFVVLNLVAVLIFKFLEEPINLYIRKKFTKKVEVMPNYNK